MTAPPFPTVLVLHGPNLNLLGTREPEIYGATSLAKIDADLSALGRSRGLSIVTFQSNSEGAIVDRVQAAREDCAGLIINPAAYTHTSIAIRDAVAMLDMPVIEVHLSNIYKREPFRHHSVLRDVVTGQIAGFGAYGYRMAVDAMAHRLAAPAQTIV